MHETRHHANQRGRGTLWLVWIIPIVAIAMAGWLVYQHYLQKGVDIVVVFDSGKGLEAGKTPLVYQGIKIGTVTDINIESNDLYKVRATITVDPRAAKYVARKGSKFVKVEPRISITEVTGLETILKGVYIELYPPARSKEALLKLPEQYHFQGLDHYPPQRYEPGLYLTLTADEGALSIGAPVLYKNFIVGKVIDKGLEKGKLLYTIHIQKEYEELVKAQSRFWRLSGFELKASLAGVKVAFDSLAVLLAGGVAFDSPPQSAPLPRDHHKRFRLYPSQLDTHLENELITLTADKAYNIDPDFSNIYYKGFKVGKIVSMHYDTQKRRTIFQIRISKQFRPLVNEKAWFWVVQPVIGIREIKGLDAIVKGPYISFDTSDVNAAPKSRFEIHEGPLPVKGRRFHLVASNAESFKSGTAIFFRDIPVGRVEKITLLPDSNKIDVQAVIFEKYAHFLNDSSMFYIKSGVEMDLSFKGIHINTGSLETLVVGGIAMVTPENRAKRQKSRYILYKDRATFEKARYLASGGAYYHIRVKRLDSIAKGSPVLYKKMKAGEVVSLSYEPKTDTIDVLIFVEKEFKKLINASTRFRNVSGVELDVNFPEMKLKMPSIESLVVGGLAFETPDKRAKKVENGHLFTLYDESREIAERYTSFELWMPDTKGLKRGSKLLYRGLPVGKVARLALENDSVKATVLIEKPYARLLRSDTTFWLQRFEANLEGVENVQNALTGPAIVLTPGQARDRAATFVLAENPPPPSYGKNGLRVELLADRRSSLKVGSPILYRQVPIGEVEKWVLSPDATAVIITAYIEPRYAHLVRQNAHFYMAGALGMDVSLLGVKIRTETLETLVAGGIGMAVPDEPGPVVENGHRFRLYNEMNPKWLAWRPKL
ncbi:MlaD family protein [Hydrogenimonas sp.]